MAGKVGMTVNYQPTAQEAANFNNNDQQVAAIITAWNEDSEKASLTLFPANADYVVSVDGVVEGTVDGTFQQPGTQSDTAKAKAEAKAAAEKAAKAQQAEQAKAAAQQKASQGKQQHAY